LNKQIIGFIGTGNMAESMIRGLTTIEFNSRVLWSTDIDEARLEYIAENYDVVPKSLETIAKEADVIILAVKPQSIELVLTNLADHIRQDKQLIISIAAGVTTSEIERHCGTTLSLVRCMPNTPAMIGFGATGLFANKRVSINQRQEADSILKTLGINAWVDNEDKIDIITAISGSGPAYFFLFIEALQDISIELGLDDNLSKKLVNQTAMGAAHLAQTQVDDIAGLRQKVTSPGGTTEAAIKVFESGGFKKLVKEAALAAHKRSVNIAKNK
jgi:pyrroline-5-carboxylate reductase